MMASASSLSSGRSPDDDSYAFKACIGERFLIFVYLADSIILDLSRAGIKEEMLDGETCLTWKKLHAHLATTPSSFVDLNGSQMRDQKAVERWFASTSEEEFGNAKQYSDILMDTLICLSIPLFTENFVTLRGASAELLGVIKALHHKMKELKSVPELSSLTSTRNGELFAKLDLATRILQLFIFLDNRFRQRVTPERQLSIFRILLQRYTRALELLQRGQAMDGLELVYSDYLTSAEVKEIHTYVILY